MGKLIETERPIARLTFRGLDTMPHAQRQEIARWLNNTARDIAKKKPMSFAPSYSVGYYKPKRA